MAWQDLVITACIVALNYALIPQIILGFKKKKSLIAFQTSLITSIALFILSITYVTLALPLSAAMGFISVALWAIILTQGIIYKINN